MTVKGNIKKERKKVGPLSSYCEFLWRWESLSNDTKIPFKTSLRRKTEYSTRIFSLNVKWFHRLWNCQNFTITHLSSKISSVHQMIATLVTMHCVIKSWCWHCSWRNLWKSLYPAQILTFTFPLQRLLGIHRGGSRTCWPAVRTLPAREWQRLRHHGESQYARLVEVTS